MTTSDWIQLASALLVLGGLLIAFVQLRLLTSSMTTSQSSLRASIDQLAESQRSNTIAAIGHCTDRYTTIMNSLPQEADADGIKAWWYLYWDLMTEESVFFRKGLLDFEIYELWTNELVNVYNRGPHGLDYMGTRAENHEAYLEDRLPVRAAVREYFDGLKEIVGGTQSSSERAEAVRALLIRFGPKTGTAPQI